MSDSGKKLLMFLSVGLHDVRAAADKNTTKKRAACWIRYSAEILVYSESEMELMVKAEGSVMKGVWMVENNSCSIISQGHGSQSCCMP